MLSQWICSECVPGIIVHPGNSLINHEITFVRDTSLKIQEKLKHDKTQSRSDKFAQLIETTDVHPICTEWDQLIKQIIIIKNLYLDYGVVGEIKVGTRGFLLIKFRAA